MVRPERRVVLTGAGPVGVSAGAPGSRLQLGGEIRPRRAECQTTRAGGVDSGDPGGVACRLISSFPGEAAIHTESRWEAATIGDTDDGAGPGGADGGEACDGADFRGRLPSVQLRILAEEERATSPGSDPSSRQPGHNFVVDADIQGYFDNIRRETLMELGGSGFRTEGY
jgi:hypothetical protein